MTKIKSILVTGSMGQLGQEFCSQIASYTDIKLWRISHSGSGGDLLKIDFEKDWDTHQLPEKCDAIVHLAQSRKFRNFPESAMSVHQVNTVSTAKLLDYAVKAGVKKFIYASSGGVYGFGDSSFTEDSPITINGNAGNYIHSKISSELLVNDYQKLFRTVILRFFFMYGEKQERTMLIPRLVENVSKSAPISLAGNDGIRINPIYVSDAATALIQCILKDVAGTFNIAGNEKMSLREICTLIGEVMGKSVVFQHTGSEPANLLGDNQSMRTELFEPVVNMREGLTKICRTYEK